MNIGGQTRDSAHKEIGKPQTLKEENGWRWNTL